MSELAVIFAHQGGWDEILLFVAPVVLAIWAVRRVDKRGREEHETEADDTSDAAEFRPTDAE